MNAFCFCFCFSLYLRHPPLIRFYMRFKCFLLLLAACILLLLSSASLRLCVSVVNPLLLLTRISILAARFSNLDSRIRFRLCSFSIQYSEFSISSCSIPPLPIDRVLQILPPEVPFQIIQKQPDHIVYVFRIIPRRVRRHQQIRTIEQR